MSLWKELIGFDPFDAVLPAPEPRACFCVGPQNGQPLCPCKMRNVEIRNGRYVEVIDHGPVREERDLAAEVRRRLNDGDGA